MWSPTSVLRITLVLDLKKAIEDKSRRQLEMEQSPITSSHSVNMCSCDCHLQHENHQPNITREIIKQEVPRLRHRPFATNEYEKRKKILAGLDRILEMEKAFIFK